MHFVFVFLIYIVFLFVSVFVFQFCILFSEAFCQILFVNQAIICHYWYLQNICSCILYLYLYSYLYFVLLYFCFQKIFCWFSFGNSANLQLLVHLENMLLMHSVFVFFLCFLSVFCTFVFQNLANDIFTIQTDVFYFFVSICIGICICICFCICISICMSTLYFCFQKLFASCYLARGLICLSLFWRHATIRSRTRTKDILPSCCFLEGKKGKNLKIFVKRICRFYIAHMWITEHLQIFKILARFKGNQIMNNNLHKYFV